MPHDCRDHRRSRKCCLRLSELIGPIGCRVAPGVQEDVAADKVGDFRQLGRDVMPKGDPVPPRGRWMAVAALLLWLGGVASGKLLLYTNTMLLTTDLEW